MQLSCKGNAKSGAPCRVCVRENLLFSIVKHNTTTLQEQKKMILRTLWNSFACPGDWLTRELQKVKAQLPEPLAQKSMARHRCGNFNQHGVLTKPRHPSECRPSMDALVSRFSDARHFDIVIFRELAYGFPSGLFAAETVSALRGCMSKLNVFFNCSGLHGIYEIFILPSSSRNEWPRNSFYLIGCFSYNSIVGRMFDIWFLRFALNQFEFLLELITSEPISTTKSTLQSKSFFAKLIHNWWFHCVDENGCPIQIFQLGVNATSFSAWLVLRRRGSSAG